LVIQEKPVCETNGMWWSVGERSVAWSDPDGAMVVQQLDCNCADFTVAPAGDRFAVARPEPRRLQELG